MKKASKLQKRQSFKKYKYKYNQSGSYVQHIILYQSRCWVHGDYIDESALVLEFQKAEVNWIGGQFQGIVLVQMSSTWEKQ